MFFRFTSLGPLLASFKFQLHSICAQNKISIYLHFIFCCNQLASLEALLVDSTSIIVGGAGVTLASLFLSLVILVTFGIIILFLITYVFFIVIIHTVVPFDHQEENCQHLNNDRISPCSSLTGPSSHRG